MKFKFLSKEEISRMPKSPGIYAFKNKIQKGAKLLYIGKAKNLRERVKNHFNRPESIWKQTLLRRSSRGRVGYVKTGSEIEALILESKLIKKYRPKYNVVWRDDKNYFYVGITKEKFPRVFITHQPPRQVQDKPKFKIDFVGPFVDGAALKQTLNILRRVFPYRTCKSYSGKPCLWRQLGRCPGHCFLGSKLAKEMPKLEIAIKKESWRNAENLKKFLEGGKHRVLKNLKKEMKSASKAEDFEKAAKARNQIASLEKVLSHCAAPPAGGMNYPAPWGGVSLRASSFGGFHPRGKLRSILEAEINQNEWKKTEGNLKKILNLKNKITRIEAYDVSNIQGKEATGSMAVFINGRPDKNHYKRFKISGKFTLCRNEVSGAGPNDVAMLKEILTRRFSHPEWGWPDLILIDGGKPQLSAAVNAKSKIPNFKYVKVIALAKKNNRLFIKGRKQPIFLKTLPRDVFNLILRLRDEAHRFALSYHLKLRYNFEFPASKD